MANAHLKALSLLIAVVLWFVVLGSRNVEITKDIPLEILTPPDLIVSNEVPDKVSFRLSGPKAFLRNILNRKEPPIRVNLSNAKSGLVTYRFFSDNIQVPIGVKVLFINPASIVVRLESVKTRDVPVRLATRGQASSGFKLLSVNLTRNTVKLKGAESKLDQIQEVQTVPVDLGSFIESGDRDVPVDLSRHAGVTVDGDLPRLHVDVSQESSNFRLRAIKVKVLTSRGGREPLVDPKAVNLYISCSAEELKKLVKSKVFAIADLRGKDPGIHEVLLTAELPDTIRLVKILPQKVKVTLK
jgi:YbbR domain-containing protein